ncbi:ABC transporter ATP-binding protein [Microvirga rosea]|uniref:ABC transporter ATP-binding protein n=1 Tax=Microvirga rosea TaxID=2715425 RepID=UPI001D0AF7A6|nr:ABC transporter ATP-binding protein [Microvirga rosea]MCB8822008.1 ABC transporter ATP-binding protein [Microvirga rosea]
MHATHEANAQLQPTLSIRDLTISFRRDGIWTPAVQQISFNISPGEIVALVGESGSGKSVTALSIAGLLDAKVSRVEGEIFLGGQSLLTLPERRMCELRGNKIAMIFQEPMTSLNPVLTIGRQISEVLVKHRGVSEKEALREAERLLEQVRIPDARSRLTQYPHNFSGGMRQRVMIAMALACRPKLLIADEPTTALDVTVQAQILDLIKDLQADGDMAVLFITHDMGVVAQIADRTVVMYRGDIVEEGATPEIFRAPARPYTRALLSAVPVLGSMADEANPRRYPIVDPVTGNPQPAPPGALTVDTRSEPLLVVKNLTARFDVRTGLFGRLSGRVHAVEDVSFDIKVGETLSLVGESGCGKSTTGRSIMRLIEPTAGEIRLDGQDIGSISGAQLRDHRRNIQMIFQDPFASLNPSMRIGSAIMEPMIIHGRVSRTQAHDRAVDLLEIVGLKRETFNRFPHEFSGGQRQRICIARALALEPKLIVADESVSALDVSIKAQIINLMLELQEKLGLAYLFISHDMAVVERVSHRVAVMYLGEIVEIGPRRAIFSNPRHPYTRKLLSAVPVPDPSVRLKSSPQGVTEFKSPIRSVGYKPPVREYVQVGDEHYVLS